MSLIVVDHHNFLLVDLRAQALNFASVGGSRARCVSKLVGISMHPLTAMANGREGAARAGNTSCHEAARESVNPASHILEIGWIGGKGPVRSGRLTRAQGEIAQSTTLDMGLHQIRERTVTISCEGELFAGAAYNVRNIAQASVPPSFEHVADSCSDKSP